MFLEKLQALECKTSFRLSAAIVIGLLLGNMSWWFIEPALQDQFQEDIVEFGQSRILPMDDGPFRPGDRITIQYTVNKLKPCSAISAPTWVSEDNQVLVREYSYQGDAIPVGLHNITNRVTIPDSFAPTRKIVGYRILQTYDCGRGIPPRSIYTPTLWIELDHGRTEPKEKIDPFNRLPIQTPH